MAPSEKEASKSPIIYTLFLVLLLATAISLGYSVAKPFFNTIIISITLSVLFYPISQRIRTMVKGRTSLAAFLTVCIIVFAIIIPALIFFLGLIGQGVDSISGINNWLKHADLSKLMDTDKYDFYLKWIEDKLPFLDLNSNDIKTKAIEYSKTFGQSMFTSGTWLAGNMAGLVAQFFIMTFLVFSFLKDGVRFITRVKYLSPLRAEQEDFIFTSLRKVSKSVLLGSLFIAILQGVVGGIGLAIVGIPALFWGAMMGFTSLIPVLGTGLIWVPALVYLLLVGKINMAIFLGLWCGILVTGIDTILRPIIVREASRVSTIYVFLAILGGINAFGALGILYGPMILTFLMVMLDIYGLEFQDVLKNKK
ncbi:Predicted PurR-regulated permease PerM [Maridesulfovibrio ferrireducens]|uniref:Predicted PurR-regulated permease PerM n=1 Tax=Maridesulfovibrio ferrireducens TaxID=246191 RepID=A0A1G9HR71_9BACT|nr:AI-2E family transporter [Maridesulfovibrio ferrireducens]SDL15491.1 Predicted PurR-regulated permease PerM [Maridesulfovibrio ferrireducens]